MMIKLLDMGNTLLEVLILYACAEITCGQSYPEWETRQYKWEKCIPYIGMAGAVYFITWVIPMDTKKIIVEMLVWCLLMKVVTKGRWRNFIVAFCLSFHIIAAVSFLEMTLGRFLFASDSMAFGGQTIAIWQDYILSIFMKLPVVLGLLTYGKHFQYEIQRKDAVIVSLVTSVLYVVCFSIGKGFYAGEQEWYDVAGATGTMLFSLCFLLLLLFYKNNVYLKERNQQAERLAQEAQMQYRYYLEKEKQEEKVRSIYHDMKNYLLVLECGEASRETRRMAEKLRYEISDYESFIQSGNRFLDVLLSDKARKAKEKQVDFSAFVDFSEIRFMDALDISTIFGNGIDNALDACEELSPEKRVVVVKGGKRENFVLILMENNFAEKGEEQTGRNQPAKKDSFLHGFGIPNIKRAVERYEGECRITRKNGRFTLTIIIPIPGQMAPAGSSAADSCRHPNN